MQLELEETCLVNHKLQQLVEILERMVAYAGKRRDSVVWPYLRVMYRCLRLNEIELATESELGDAGVDVAENVADWVVIQLRRVVRL